MGPLFSFFLEVRHIWFPVNMSYLFILLNSTLSPIIPFLLLIDLINTVFKSPK